MKREIIGLTGLYCSGKSTLEKTLKEQQGYTIIDVDKTGHRALESEQERLVEAFSEIILTNGRIDRKKLGPIVFKDKKKLRLLNSIVHPVMVTMVEKDLQTIQGPVCISAALLFEMGLDRLCEKVIVVTAPFFTIVKRGTIRDGHSLLRIVSILFSQKVMQLSKKNSNNVDIYYVRNNRDTAHLVDTVSNITGS